MQCLPWIYRLYSNKIKRFQKQKRYNQSYWIHVIINFPKKVTRNCMAVIKERHVNTYKRRTLISRKHKDFGHQFFSKNTHNRYSSWNPKCLHRHFAQSLSNIEIYFFHHSLFGTKTYMKKTSTLKGLKFTVLNSEKAAIFQLVSTVGNKFIFNITCTMILGLSSDF